MQRVYQFYVSPSVEKEVFRFQIAVNDVISVEVCEGFQYACHDEPSDVIVKVSAKTKVAL